MCHFQKAINPTNEEVVNGYGRKAVGVGMVVRYKYHVHSKNLSFQFLQGEMFVQVYSNLDEICASHIFTVRLYCLSCVTESNTIYYLPQNG